MPIHTLTVGKQPLKANPFKRICQRLFSMAQEGTIPSTGNGYLNFQNIHVIGYAGITIRLSKSPFRRIELIVNPTRILGGTYADLYELTTTAMQEISDVINALLLDIAANFSFSEMCLSRVDCTKDITLPYADLACELIGCLKRSKLGRGYERQSFGCGYKNFAEKNRHSFRASCRDICLTVYEKSFQLKEEKIMPLEKIPPNRLRFEVSFSNASFQRLLQHHLQGTVINQTLEEKILYFSDLSITLLQTYFNRGVMPGRFLRLDAAKAEIENSWYSPATKEEMKRFMYQVRREYKLGVDGALFSSGLSERQSKYLLACFRELDLNPAALPMSSNVREVPSILQMLTGNRVAI